MRALAKVLLVAALLGAAAANQAYTGKHEQAAKRTVCTITVNSSDEADAFRQRLPKDQFEFVELVERGRPDWLASACQQRVSCDMLIISGHFNGRTDFFSGKPDVREFLPVEEMERVSCSDSCPGLFSHLKEVYLFGCNTLNPAAIKAASPEIARSLVRSGHSPAEAERIARSLDARHGESSRDRMRRIFKSVPLIYGFSSTAPLGPVAGSRLAGYLHAAPLSDIGTGRVSTRLLHQFASSSLTVARGLSDADSGADYRREVCEFVDDRVAAADKLHFIHALLRRNTAEARLFLDRIESLFAQFSERDRQAPAFQQALADIARDRAARDRYLRFAEDADEPAVRARMIAVAGHLGWFTPEQQHAEIVRMMGQLLARPAMGTGEVDLICSLNKERSFDGDLERLSLPPSQNNKPAPAAGAACLGSADARTRVLAALSSTDDEEVKIAEVYLHHHPITDVTELRALADGVARMPESPAQVRALETLARHHLHDGETLDALAQLFPTAGSIDVQRAIADLIIRSDYHPLAKPEFVRMLSERRLKSPNGKDIIDILIRRLQAAW